MLDHPKKRLPPERLEDGAIAGAAARERVFRLYDGGGLYLEVTPTGAKLWRSKYRFAGKEKRLSLGVYPDVGLADARRANAELRTLLAEGIDPSAHRKAMDATERAARVAAFAVDNDGALTVRLPRRHFILSPDETAELRQFLTATRSVGAQPCD